MIDDDEILVIKINKNGKYSVEVNLDMPDHHRKKLPNLLRRIVKTLEKGESYGNRTTSRKIAKRRNART